MCILIVKPKGVQLPDYATLCRCANLNPHGFGFAMPNKRPYKTLSFDKFIDALSRVDEDMPMILHFRLATHGSIKQTNCHPFRDNKNGLIFAHNGVLDINALYDKTDSETAFRLLFVPAYEKFGLRSNNFNQAVNSIRGGSRFAFLTDKGEVKTFGNFISHNGCLYSNNGFTGYRTY